MKVCVVAAVLLGVGLSGVAQGEGPLAGKRLAVLEFSSGRGDESRSPEALTEACRGGAVEAARGLELVVSAREDVLRDLAQLQARHTEYAYECAGRPDREWCAEYFVTGTVLEAHGEPALVLKAFERRSGRLMGQERVAASSEAALSKRVGPACERWVRSLFGPPMAASRPPLPESAENEVAVKFESIPAGASVLVDGQQLCAATPCSRWLPAGPLVVVFEKERYETLRVSAVTGRGTVVSGTLPPKFGWLSVVSTPPGLRVTVDGVDVGRTPLVEREVGAGPVSVSMADGCYVQQSRRVSLGVGERQTVSFSAEVKTAGLRVLAQDAQGNALEARVRVDGRDVGETGATLTVPLCSRELSLQLGSRHWVDTLRLVEGKVTRLRAGPRTGMVTFAGGAGIEPFRLDAGPVSVAAYAACVDSGTCTAPSSSEDCAWGVPGKEAQALGCVTWDEADTYCRWAGKRLPEYREWCWVIHGPRDATPSASDEELECIGDFVEPSLGLNVPTPENDGRVLSEWVASRHGDILTESGPVGVDWALGAVRCAQ